MLQLSKNKKDSYFKRYKVDESYSDLYNDLVYQFNYFGSPEEYDEEMIN